MLGDQLRFWPNAMFIDSWNENSNTEVTEQKNDMVPAFVVTVVCEDQIEQVSPGTPPLYQETVYRGQKDQKKSVSVAVALKLLYSLSSTP